MNIKDLIQAMFGSNQKYIMQVLQQLEKGQEKEMAALDDILAAVNAMQAAQAAEAEAVTAIQADVAQIATLTAELANANPTVNTSQLVAATASLQAATTALQASFPVANTATARLA